MATQSKTHALLIGINYYPSNDTDKSSLRGCVNDINGFHEHLKSYLQLQKLNPSEYITVLTSTIDRTGTNPYTHREKPANLPTYENIINALQKIALNAKAGDTVFVAYSGHGSRVKTLVPNWPGKSNGWDEVICPYNIKQPGGKPVRDFELNYFFTQMVGNGIKLTVVLDSCYSGGATRGPEQGLDGVEEPMPRGLPKEEVQVKSTFEEYLGWSPLGKEIDNVKASWVNLQEGLSNSGLVPTTEGRVGMILRRPIGYAVFTGCLAHELSWEVSNPRSGKLSNAIKRALEIVSKLSPEVARTVTLDKIYRFVFSAVYGEHYQRSKERYILQSPLLLGQVDRQFPGASVTAGVQQRPPGPATIVIRPARSESNIVSDIFVLGAGEAHGVLPGMQFGVYLWYQDPQDIPEVKVVITQVRSTRSLARLLPDTILPSTWSDCAEKQGDKKWPTGCIAKVLTGSPAHAKRVYIVGNIPDLTTKVFVQGEIPLRFVTDQGTADYQLSAATTGDEPRYELHTMGENRELLTATTTLSAILNNTLHIARYNSLLSVSGTRYAYCYKFLRCEPTAEENPNRVYMEFMWDEDNTGKHYANLAVFHFAPKEQGYAIRKVYPVDGAFESVDRLDKRRFSFDSHGGWKGGVLKALVFHASTSFDIWEMPPLQGESAGAKRVGEMLKNVDEVQAEVHTDIEKDTEMDSNVEEPRFMEWCTKVA